MTYAAAQEYLLTQLPMFQRIGAAAYRADLNNITALCHMLGNPQQHLRCIHVAGTNGKGSVSHLMASLLQSAGYKVGVFTSPHYKDFRERIKINGTYISEEFVCHFVEENRQRFEKVNASFFEMTTAMAFAYFHQQLVDFAIIEVGLGGRLDSTNIITPILSVITNISFDHQQFLGDTLPQIAAEKAGIIKQNITVVVGETHPETEAVFREKAMSVNAPIVFADQHLRIEKLNEWKGGNMFVLKRSDTSNETKFFTDLQGDYQRKNIVTAMQALWVLQKQGVKISMSKVKDGLRNVIANTGFTGRWMLIGKKPLTIFDSAHNEGGLRQLREQLFQLRFEHLHFVYGAVGDKDISKCLAVLPKGAHYYFCKPDLPRGKDTSELKREAALFNLPGEVYPSVADAFHAAKANAGKDDLVLVAGSIFVVAELL